VQLLADTSVWSLALRRKNTARLSPNGQKLKANLVQAIQDGRVAMLGLLRQELLSGIKEKAQFDKVKAALNPYLDEPVTTADHEYAAHVYNEYRNQGVEAGTVDILICAVAVRRGWEVLSGDGGLNRYLAATRKFHERQKRTSATEEVKTSRTSRK
jgi:predicted nucleic acid-binding protein